MTGKIHMALRYGLVLLLAVLIGSGCSAGTVYAEGNLQAAHDDGSGNVYGSLDTN